MLITEKNRIALAVAVVMQRPEGDMQRFARAQVLFPDLGGKPVLIGVGFLRYPGEKSIVKPEATEDELSLFPGLTVDI